jgi:hypothetical protein
MDWPVVGSIAGVTALAGSLALGGWLELGSTPMQTNNRATPVLLVDAHPPQQSILYSKPQRAVPEHAPILASLPQAGLAELPYSEREKPLRVPRVTSHAAADAPPKHSILAKPHIEKLPERTQQKPLPTIVDERYAHVLTTDKIGQLRRMLHLRSDQTQHWPPVEAMLHQIGRIQMAHVRRGEKPEVDSGVMMQLYSAAQPLLASLLPEQKEKIRSLARSLGYPNVASLL